MGKRIVRLARDPFFVDLGEEGGWWFVDPGTGSILFGSAALHAWRGLAFSLVPSSEGKRLNLKYSDSTYDIGWTDDADAAIWVEAVNAFLATKRTAEPNRNGAHSGDANLVTSSGVDQTAEAQ